MNNKLLKFSFMLILVCSIILLPMAVEAIPIKFNYSIFLPSNHPQTIVAINWLKEVEKESDGKVEFVIYPNSLMTGPLECYYYVVSGAVDIAFISSTFLPDRFPVFGALKLPFGFPNGTVASSVANQFVKEIQPKELNDVKVLYVHATGPTYLHTIKPIRNIKNIKGLKILSSYQSSEIISALGASPLQLPISEAYEGFQKGIIDGLYTPKWILQLFSLADVIKYTTDTSVIGDITPMLVIMNKHRWDVLPSNLQELFERKNDFWVKRHGETWDKMEDDAVNYLVEFRHQFIELPEDEDLSLQEIVKPIFERYKQEVTGGIEYIKKIEDLIIKVSSRKCPSGYYNCNTIDCCKKK